ncbi:MAG: antibiotic biosynthesis monooxygenase, partial [Mycetocola sp.]
MLTKALLVRLEALPGKETDLADFLTEARSIVMEEPGTVAWFAIQFGPSTFGVFD